jgi:hypothetical protein
MGETFYNFRNAERLLGADAIADKYGMPHSVFEVPKTSMSDLGFTGNANPHAAFAVNGAVKDSIFISRYDAWIAPNGVAYSLPDREPKTSINFDTASAACRAANGNGVNGFHLITNAEWALLALWCKANGFQPLGNNNYGKDITKPTSKGKAVNPANITKTLTGNDPDEWAHNGKRGGIFDLNGNVWDWTAGMRIVDGEIQIIEDNNSADPSADLSATSLLWKAILEDGTLVSPGTADTLKFDGTNPIKIVKTRTATTSQSSRAFGAITSGTDVATIPDIVKALLLAPIGAVEEYNGDAVWLNGSGERVPIRGGHWYHGAAAGLFALGLNYSRSHVDSNLGFRSAFVNL